MESIGILILIIVTILVATVVDCIIHPGDKDQ